MRIYWIHGLYSTIVFGEKVWGGLVRTKSTQLLLKSIIPSAEIIDVVIKRPFEMTRKQSSGFLQFPLEISSIIMRGFSKFLRKIPPLRRLGIGLNSISTKMRCRDLYEKLSKDNGEYLLVVDSIRGYMAIQSVFDKIASKALAVLYLSHNYEPEFVGSKFLWNYLEKVERRIITSSDLVLAVSMRDFKVFKHKYGVDDGKVIFLPNIYPVDGLELSKFKSPSISLILPDNWGTNAIHSTISYISEAVRMSEKVKKLVIVGRIAGKISQQKKWGDAVIETYSFIRSRRKFLETIGKAHIGVNFAFKSAGTNVKKYDYALTKQVVLSNFIGAKGDLLPYEYTFLDKYDLASKIDQIFDRDYLKMGEENALFAHKLYQKAKKKIKAKLLEMLK